MPDDYEQKANKLKAIFGESSGTVYHSPVPFYLGPDVGGAADVYHFNKFNGGNAYCTFELIGSEQQIRNSLGTYELALCTEQPTNWAANLISRLANYTRDSVLNSGETISIGSWENGNIVALLFSEFSQFKFNGEDAGILMCVGITNAELEFCMQNGSEQLLTKLIENKIYPFTVFDRESLV